MKIIRPINNPRVAYFYSLMGQLSNAAEHVLHYLNADETKVVGTTYSAIWQLMKTIDCRKVYSETALMNNIIVTVKSLDDRNSELTSNDSPIITIPVNTVRGKLSNSNSLIESSFKH